MNDRTRSSRPLRLTLVDQHLPQDISLPEADDRLAKLELQLDGTPGRRYRGAPKAGLACWLCQLHVYRRNPQWADVAGALASYALQVFQDGAEDTKGFQLGHLQVLSYMMALRPVLQNHQRATNRLRKLEELEVRADEIAADLAGMFKIMQVMQFL